MVRNSKQQWQVGQTVKVGFMQLVVRQVVGAPYILTNKAGDKLYAFEPYTGCRAITASELESLREDARIAEQNARADAWDRAQSAARVNALFA